MNNSLNKEFYPQEGIAITSRDFSEYCRMFMLEESLLSGKIILDVSSGASSFRAEGSKKGIDITSADPSYHLSFAEMVKMSKKELNESLGKISDLQHLFAMEETYGSFEKFSAGRITAVDNFLSDYNLNPKKYVPASLPVLPFDNEKFDLVFCSHFLFLYSETFDISFHIKSVLELIRVVKNGGSVMIYPLIGLNREVYPHLSELLDEIAPFITNAEFVSTQFEFVPNANNFLKITK